MKNSFPLTHAGILDNPHEPINTSKTFHASQEAQSMLKFQTRKNKNSRDTEPPQREVPTTMPQFSPDIIAATLQKETRGFLRHNVYQNINAIDILEKSGVLVDSDELTERNIKFSEMQQNWALETGNSMEEAPSDGTHVATLRGNDKIMEIIDWDSDEEMSGIVIECGESVAQNTNLLKIEDNKIAKAVNLIEESEVDGLGAEGARGDTKEKVNLDLYEVQKSSDAMIIFDKLNDQNPNFDQKDGFSLTEETKIEHTTLTEAQGMKELGEIPNADQEFTEKDCSSNPALETLDKEYDSIKHPNLLEISGKLICHKEFGDQAPESSQVETYYNQIEEKDTREAKLMELYAEHEKLKIHMAKLHALQRQFVHWFQGIAMELNGMLVETMESDEMSTQSFESGSDSFSSKS